MEWYFFVIYGLFCSWLGLLMLMINKPVLGLIGGIMCLFLCGIALGKYKDEPSSTMSMERGGTKDEPVKK